MKAILTREQSDELLRLDSELGLGLHLSPADYPIFSLADLLAILPKEIDTPKGIAKLRIRQAKESANWVVDYWTWYSNKQVAKSRYAFHNKELVDAIYNLIVYSYTTGL